MTQDVIHVMSEADEVVQSSSNKVSQALLDNLIGKDTTEATILANADGITVLVLEDDSSYTLDYREDRVKLNLVDGVVSVATVG